MVDNYFRKNNIFGTHQVSGSPKLRMKGEGNGVLESEVCLDHIIIRDYGFLYQR
jgi:hypothetical protein